MKAIFRFVFTLLSVLFVFVGADAQITIQSQSLNQVRLSLNPPQTNPLNTTTFENLPPGTPWRRFQAFWVMGDGNFIEFAATPTDEGSLNPPDYYYDYSVSDTFRATAYLTGKYTNTTPPPQYVSPKITLGGRGTTASAFRSRLLGKRLDIHSNHAVRKGYLTTFVVSYPVADNTPDKRLYFFYNGRRTGAVGNPIAFNSSVVKYYSSDIPQYFQRSNAPILPSAITERATLTLPPGLRNFSGAYSNFVAYPRENVQANEMPNGFTEKRQFPIILADPSGLINLSPNDSLLSFVAILTGSKSLNPDVDSAAIQQIMTTLASVGITNLNPLEPIMGVDSSEEYIIGAEEKTLPYMAAFDPNQLTVENIQPIGNGEEYLVTFRLEICNSGSAAVENESISIHYVPGTFWRFNYPTQAADYHYLLDPATKDGEWRFNIQMILPGIEPADASGHKEECGFIRFTALTDCKGVRSLWQENGGQAVEACVVFKESFSQEPECHYNFPIKSDQFKDAEGKCICCVEKPCPKDPYCSWQYCLLLLLALLLILLWLVKSKYIPWLSKLFS